MQQHVNVNIKLTIDVKINSKTAILSIIMIWTSALEYFATT
jgi:hypothetical protein